MSKLRASIAHILREEMFLLHWGSTGQLYGSIKMQLDTHTYSSAVHHDKHTHVKALGKDGDDELTGIQTNVKQGPEGDFLSSREFETCMKTLVDNALMVVTPDLALAWM